MEQRNDERLAVLMLILGSTFYGFNNVLTKLALSVATPWSLLSMRFILALILLTIPVILGKEKLRFDRRNLLPLILFMIIEPVYFIFESFAIKLTNATYTGGILALSPVTSAILAAVLLHEFPSKREVFFSCFPVTGILLMSLTGSKLGIVSPLGAFCLIGTCLSASGIRIFNRGAAVMYSAYERTYAMMVSCCLYFTYKALREVHFDPAAYAAPLKSPSFIVCLLGLVLLCSIGSNLMGNWAAGKLSVVRYTSLSSVSTLFSLFTGVIFLHEPMTPVSFTGALLILIGLRGISNSALKRVQNTGRKAQLPHKKTDAEN